MFVLDPNTANTHRTRPRYGRVREFGRMWLEFGKIRLLSVHFRSARSMSNWASSTGIGPSCAGVALHPTKLHGSRSGALIEPMGPERRGATASIERGGKAFRRGGGSKQPNTAANPKASNEDQFYMIDALSDGGQSLARQRFGAWAAWRSREN